MAWSSSGRNWTTKLRPSAISRRVTCASGSWSSRNISKSSCRSTCMPSITDIKASDWPFFLAALSPVCSPVVAGAPEACEAEGPGSWPLWLFNRSDTSSRISCGRESMKLQPFASSRHVLSFSNMPRTCAICLRCGRRLWANSASFISTFGFCSRSRSNVGWLVESARTTPFRKVLKASPAESSVYRTTWRSAAWPSRINRLVSLSTSGSDIPTL
mmetsp:Transcript_52685/g.122872  ORF Transcript_52685/g.122872 Transcript_52685/m.122872 type:complete len:215 (-) Transcript_52685:21-665(-)